jgi:hypothetical protein
MPGVTCQEARQLLRSAASGRSVSGPSPAWTALERLGALAGTPEHPSLTPAGEQGLRELDLRAYRADAWPLDTVLMESQRVAASIEEAARIAALFLNDLGPIVPPESLPYVRVVATGLANRRGEPGELAGQFRQVWGMVEVMGGDARDRLLAAELFQATGASMTEVYAQVVNTSEQLTEWGAAWPMSSAAVMHIDPHRVPHPPLHGWQEARKTMPSDDMASLLAMVSLEPSGRRRFEAFRDLFAKDPGISGQYSEARRLSTALYLAAIGADPAEGIARISKTASLLSSEAGRPLLLAAILTHGAALGNLAPEELVEWVHHAAAAANRAQLAATDAEFEALGVAIVEGLPADVFANPPSGGHLPNPFADAVTLLALHAWIYRGILEPTLDTDGAPA